jgi:hypothetical protein
LILIIIIQIGFLLKWVDELNRFEYPDVEILVYKKALTIEEKIIKTFPEAPELMLAIAKCESGVKQFREDGTVVKSPTRDFGLFQINEKTWHRVAQELGYDYKGSLDDNLKMARYVYDTQGITAWVCYR